jgi:uncharacterized protein (TIGR00255 family)
VAHSLTSMTGFAFGEASAGPVRITAEVKSYNNRYLDLILGLPPALASWEPALRDLLAGAIARGRVEVNVRLKEAVEGTSVEVDEALALQYTRALGQLKKATGAKGAVSLELLAAQPGVLGAARDVDPAQVRSAAETLVKRLVAEFNQARKTEGARLGTDIVKQLDVVTQGRLAITAKAASMEVVFRENLQKKFHDLAAEADENRILAETALLLVRYGINEELVRLESHEQTFRALLTETGPVGKKLDFLCQELGREINTIGSKTTFAEVQQQVVAMKDALENIREQLRNVE